jgi:RNA polymerase sigma factor (sigma-70 family)
MAAVAPEFPVLAREKAFEALYRRYVADVYHYALALLRNPADAEDVTQTTFMNAYRAYRRGDEIEKPQNWLIKIAHNVARSRYARASRRVKEVPLEEHIDQLAVPEEDRPDVEGVLRALGRLPFNQRAALVMRELEGRSYAEIADAIGVSVAAVETLIFRARRSLKLRTSALRALAAVPLPSSLSQLFGGGGAVAGGGLVGSGFAVKIGIALLAGAVATGVGGNDTRPAKASPAREAAIVQSTPAATTSRSIARAARSVAVRPTAASVTAARPRVLRPGLDADKPETAAAVTPAADTSAPAQAAPSNSQPIPEPVANVVETVEKAAPVAVPALPVELPSVPELPVQLPPPPPLPSLP